MVLLPLDVYVLYIHHLKPGSHTSAIIGDCKTKNIIEFVSRELPLRHDTRWLTNIPDSIEPSGRIEIITHKELRIQLMLCNKIYSVRIPDCK